MKREREKKRKRKGEKEGMERENPLGSGNLVRPRIYLDSYLNENVTHLHRLAA